MTSRSLYLTPSFGVLAALLSGCTDNSTPVSIDYRQIGFCDTYTTAGGVRAAKPNEAYVVYKIEAVDNAKRNTDFNFVPARLYVDPGEWGTEKTPWKSKPGDAQDWFYQRDRRRYVFNDTGFTQAVGVHALTPEVISPAVRQETAGFAIVDVPAPGQGRSLEQISFKLSYDSQERNGESIPADPPIILNSTNGGQAAWPHPASCQELTLDKLAS
jgi:hypothetical protein